MTRSGRGDAERGGTRAQAAFGRVLRSRPRRARVDTVEGRARRHRAEEFAGAPSRSTRSVGRMERSSRGEPVAGSGSMARRTLPLAVSTDGGARAIACAIAGGVRRRRGCCRRSCEVAAFPFAVETAVFRGRSPVLSDDRVIPSKTTRNDGMYGRCRERFGCVGAGTPLWVTMGRMTDHPLPNLACDVASSVKLVKPPAFIVARMTA